MAQEKRALRLNAGQFTRLIKITRATSRYAERDVLVLMLGHHCGLCGSQRFPESPWQT